MPKSASANSERECLRELRAVDKINKNRASGGRSMSDGRCGCRKRRAVD